MVLLARRLALLALLAPSVACGLSPSSIGDAALYDMRPAPADFSRTTPDIGMIPCMQDIDCPRIQDAPRLYCRGGTCVF